MRLGFARIYQKSNSFARTASRFDDFATYELLNGAELVERYAGTGTVAGGVQEACAARELEFVPLISAVAVSGGPVEPEGIAELASRLDCALDVLDQELDALVLDVSGAMTTTEGRSGEHLIVEDLRTARPQLPIVLTVTGQANLSNELSALIDALVAPGSLPDADPAETGARSVDVAVRLASGERFQVLCQRLPLLIPVAAQRSSEEPLGSLFDCAAKFNNLDDIACVAILAGYPYTDADHTGASVVITAVSDNAQDFTDQLAGELWQRRTELFVQGSNVEEAVHHAMASKDGPVLIVDLGDNPDDGAPGDGTTVLWALMDLGVRSATIGAIADEQAVEACVRAGVDARVEIPVGGRRDTRHGYPIDIRAKVVSTCDGTFTLNGPIGRGLEVDPGRIVVLDVEARHEGHVELILCEKPIQIIDTALFEHVGIDISQRKIVSIKSTNDYRHALGPLASAIFEVITPGITTPDPQFFIYERLRRPIFPLDPMQ